MQFGLFGYSLRMYLLKICEKVIIMSYFGCHLIVVSDIYVILYIVTADYDDSLWQGSNNELSVNYYLNHKSLSKSA